MVLGQLTLALLSHASQPKGGVKEGQKFAVPFAGGAETVRRTQAPQINVPVGAWRDGLFDCFAYGLCHDHLCVALFCPLSKLIGKEQYWFAGNSIFTFSKSCHWAGHFAPQTEPLWGTRKSRRCCGGILQNPLRVHHLRYPL